ncbi:D-glycero-beta-D-manno-heptose 1,7-bisphosphate 7-phosphatase [Rhodoferax sp.]|uniref:D-glycero-beta-D-manno-heptose 1,7-bisphosphate 7-phosphatase n=1 Tax=Rhodoferax sp. TaxID=50421 RepID=UPI002601D7C6|nr:D-glycero-beta-D-manno-heptose 1,7-bisphosphate 7-phosphatase [Rhodoferax sp.]MDD2926056.1 D-glycero-beta-D-manno-heptose 1,7-bisphosphate 7-phosphatase [Rhodoferax sp.]
MTPIKLVILDRDGTINHDSAEFIKSADEWVALPGALEAIARLNQAGWHVVVASNQSGLGRGLFEVSDLNAIHAKLHQQLSALGGRIDAVFYCPHTPDDACACRKPAAGLFEQISERYGMDLKGVPAVGDSARDLVAGVALGCEPHLVLTGKGLAYKGRSLPEDFPSQTQVHADLAAFADHLLAREADAG